MSDAPYKDEDQRINGHDYNVDEIDPHEGADVFETAMWNAYPPAEPYQHDWS